MNTALLIAMAVLQIADWLTTRKILANGGRELNPIVAKGMKLTSVDAFLIGKGIAVVALSYWLGTQSVWMLGGLVVFYAMIVAHNLRSL